MVLNALSVDVEDYYQVSGFERQISRDHWHDYESRVVVNTQRLLDLFAAQQVQATFFVLGWVASHYPQLVRQIDSAGHELGSHSYWHRLVYQQTAAEFREDLVRSRKAIEDALGATVTAYRAPSFSITRQSLWALDILAEEGFQIDSSIFPIVHDRYGIPGARPFVHQLQTAAGPLWEFPPSVLRAAGSTGRFPAAGIFDCTPPG